MDWTGGERRRVAAGKNNSLLQRQKAYFAKARTTHKPSSRHLSGHGLEDVPDRSRVPSLPPAVRKGIRYDYTTVSPHQGATQTVEAVEQEATHTTNTVYRSADLIMAPGDQQASQTPRYIESDHLRNPSVIRRPMRSRQFTPQDHNMGNAASEEDQLLANRRRLLARTDWLGLTATRPVYMRFSSASDKDRVGKRRKVEKFARKTKPAHRRLLTPLFQERVHQPEYLISGALPTDDIRIKVGTDALATLTQRSRRTPTPVEVNRSQSPTLSRPLSEESMLLGGEDDRFDFEQSAAAMAINNHNRGAMRLGSMAAFAGSQATIGVQYVPRSPEMRLLSSHDSDGGTTIEQAACSTNASLNPDNRHKQSPSAGAGWAGHGSTSRTVQSQTAKGRSSGRQHFGYGAKGMSLPTNPLVHRSNGEEEDDDEQIWKRLMNIDQRESSHASMAVMRSSSRHTTTSESNPRPVLRVSHKRQLDDGHTIAVPEGAERPNLLAREAEHLGPPSSSLQSPSASFLQIDRLAEQPARLQLRPADDADDNALWRQFVVGSDDEDSDQLLRIDTLQSVKGTQHGRSDNSPSLLISGLGTSDNATYGDSLFVSQSAI